MKSENIENIFLSKKEILSITILSFSLVLSKISEPLLGTVALMSLMIILIQSLNNPMIAIFWSLWYGESISGLLPQKVTLGSLSLQVSDISLLCILIFIVCSLRKKIPIIKQPILIMISVVWLVILIIGTSNGLQNTAQSWLMTIFTQRRILPFIVLPFISMGLYLQKLPIKQLEYFITRIAAVILIISISQWLLMYLQGPIIFEGTINMRLGYRLYFPTTITRIGASIVWYRILENGFNLKRLVFIVAFFVQIVFITQSRATFVAIIITFIIAFLFFANKTVQIIVIPIMIAGMIIFFTTKTGQEVYQYYLGELGSSDTNNTIGFREYEKNFYEGNLIENELFGLGGINNGDPQNEHLIGTQRGMFLSDLGSFEVKYYYGFLGYAMYYILLVVAILKSFSKQVVQKPYFIMIFLFPLLVSQTQSYLYYSVAISVIFAELFVTTID